jgi:hypothetical protein
MPPPWALTGFPSVSVKTIPVAREPVKTPTGPELVAAVEPPAVVRPPEPVFPPELKVVDLPPEPEPPEPAPPAPPEPKFRQR